MESERARWQKTRGHGLSFSQSVFFLPFLLCNRKEGEQPWLPPLLWQLSAHSLVSHIALCFQHSDTGSTCTAPRARIHIYWISLYFFFWGCRITQIHTHAAEWRATDTARGLSRSHRGDVPSHSLYSCSTPAVCLEKSLGDTLLTVDNIRLYVILANECVMFLSPPHSWGSQQCLQSTRD